MKIINFIKKLHSIPPLFFRLILAYGFFTPAMAKLNDINAIASWFEGMNFPLPLLNAYLATSTEVAGVILLSLGLATRLISLPLMFVMVIAILTVHLNNGFEASKNGFEIPFYYFFMLFSLLITGAGKFSLDFILAKKYLATKHE